MTIKCRTGCEEQVHYEEYVFPDGFIYFLPKNKDKTIHKCKNLPDSLSMELINRPEDISKIDHDNYLMEYAVTDGLLYDEYLELLDVVKPSTEWELKQHHELLKKELKRIQTLLILLPSPFTEEFNDLICLNPEINPESEMQSNLIYLSLLYEYFNDYVSAEKARLIQDKVTHDQAEKLVELSKKQMGLKKNKDRKILELNISAQELRNDYFRKVENMVKSFIRKKYSSNEDLEKDFPTLYQKANELRGNPSRHIEHTKEDVIEFLSFGQCIKILKTNRNVKEDKEWSMIDYHIIDYAYFIVDRRNDMDHYSGENIEESIPKESKTLGYIYSKEIIEFFENLKYA